jgi:hypothetical protein
MFVYGVDSYLKYSIIHRLLNVSVLPEPFAALSEKSAARSMENLHGNILDRVQASAQSKTMEKRVPTVCRTPHRKGNLGTDYGLRPTKEEGAF